MIRYIKLKDGYIIDMISYPYEGYILLDNPNISDGLHCGCYKYLGDNNFVLDDMCYEELQRQMEILEEII